MTAPSLPRQQLAIKFLLLLAGYFFLHILLRVLISDSLDYDEAEQALLGQWLLAGYTEQPPLYTWMQHALFALFGKNVFAVSLLKNGLLFFTYVFVFLTCQKVTQDTRRAILATCSLLLIPQIAWESQRDMTHTTLVVCAAAASFWQALRLVEKQNLLHYLIFGLVLSVGVLGKANFAIFVAALLLTLASFSVGRRVLFSRRIVLTMLIIFLITGPYFLWMVNNQDIVFSTTHKLKQTIEGYQLQGITSLFVKSFLFLTPLWLILLVLFPTGFGRAHSPENDFHHQFIQRYFLVLLVLLLITIFAFKVTYVKDRWLQPLLFAAPVLFFSRLDPAQVTPRRFKLFLAVVSTAAVAVYFAFAIRVVGASYIDRFCRMNYPFAELAEDLRQKGFNDGLIISDSRFLAGNMSMQFPNSSALIPGYNFEIQPSTQGFSTAAVLWEVGKSSAMPAGLATFLERSYQIAPTDYPIRYLEHRYKYGRTETVTFATMQFPLLPIPKT